MNATIKSIAVMEIDEPIRDETSEPSRSVVAIDMNRRAGMKKSAATVASVFESIGSKRPITYPERITTRMGSMWRNGAMVMILLYLVSYTMNKWRTA